MLQVLDMIIVVYLEVDFDKVHCEFVTCAVNSVWFPLCFNAFDWFTGRAPDL